MKVACIQYNAGPDWKLDIDTARGMLDEGGAQGATLIVLPESCAGVGVFGGLPVVTAFPEHAHPALAGFSRYARDRQIELVAGSVGIVVGDGRRLNLLFMIRSDGEIYAQYDKIHLCDIDMPNCQLRESDVVAPGRQLVTALSQAALIGLSISYDIRFPRIYRRYVQAGANVLTITAAFVWPMGKAHWRTLIRARVIETGCFVLAAGQCGQFESGLELFGHSMIVDPWGRVLAEVDDEAEVIAATIEMSWVAEARQNIPAWSNQLRDELRQIPLTGDYSVRAA